MGVCFRVSEDSILASSEQAFGPSGRSNSTPIADESSSIISRSQNDTATSEKLAATTSGESTSSPVGSPARTSATPEGASELTASAAGSGPNTHASFANFDPATSSWKTSQLCLDGEWSEFSETWPRAGMTRSGKAFELPMLAPHTEETESGLWPTPNVGGGGNPPGLLTPHKNHFVRPSGQKAHLSLDQAVKMWPTPTAVTNTGGAALCKWGGAGARAKLRTMVSEQELNGALNPTWVEWLMGYPLGWTALEDSATPSFRKSRSGSAEE